jgi:hypothetical protein
MTTVVHCVTIQWGEHVDHQRAAADAQAIVEELAVAFCTVAVCRHGSSLLLPESVDYAIVFEFESMETFDTYVSHERHQQLKDLLASTAASRQHVQFAGTQRNNFLEITDENTG